MGIIDSISRPMRRARSFAVRVRQAGTRRAVDRITGGFEPGTETRDLVEVGLAASRGATVAVLGANPFSDQITVLAGVCVPGSLPPAEYDRVVLSRIPSGALGRIAVANAVQALRPGGTLITSAPLAMRRELRTRFDSVTTRRVGPWVVVSARGRRP